MSDAGAHLRASLQAAAQTGDRLRVLDCLAPAGTWAATRRWAEAVTVWAAYEGRSVDLGLPELQDACRRQESLRKAGQALGPEKTQAAPERVAAMTLATVAQFASVVTAPQLQGSSSLAQLSAREWELVILVARGATDAQIAAQLYISVSTVRSYLDRIRDKTGCRRRADLTRLALRVGLV
jgi:DNA-binding CsgD family transcriptional regulator